MWISQPVKDDGKEGNGHSDHEWNFGLQLNELTLNIAALRLGEAFDCTLKGTLNGTLNGTRAHLSIPYASIAPPCKTFSHISGSSKAEGSGRRVEGGGSRVESIGIGGEGCSTAG